MQSWVEIVRFFRVVRPVPRIARLTFAVLTALCMARVALVSERPAGALLPILVLQAFTVSSGFLADARRGHFDVLFTRGAGRVQVAVVYWLLCATPGIVCWGLLAAAGVLLRRDFTLLTSGTLVTMLSVSSIPWALTVPLSRFAGAIGWLLLVVCIAPFVPVSLDRLGDAGPIDSWAGAITMLVVPVLFIGHDIRVVWPEAVAVVLVATLAMVLALFWIRSADLPLESGQ